MTIASSRTVQLDSTGASGTANPLSLTCSSELMEHYVAGSPVDPSHKIGTAQDATGNPLLFSIGSDGHFYVVMSEPGSPTGWTQIDLTPTGAAGTPLVSFGVSQDLTGTIHLALGAAATAGTGGSALLLPPMSSDATATDWASTPGQWVSRPFPSGAFAVSEIVVGTTDDQQGAPTVLMAGVVSGTANQNGAQHYVVDTTSDTWTLVAIPENATKVIDMVPFSQKVGRGVVTLYQVTGGNTLDMVFTTFPNPKFGNQSLQAPLQVPPEAAALAVLPEASGMSDLYVAGQGLFTIPSAAVVQALINHTSAASVPVASATAIPAATELLAAQDSSGTVALWTLDGTGALTATTRPAGGMIWTTPLAIQQGVAQIAALRNLQSGANELVTLGIDGTTVTHFWQDPTTTMWQSGPILVQDTNSALLINCYATQLHLADATGSPVITTELTINSSQLCYVTINGAGTVVGPTASATAPTDGSGSVTIITSASGISTPLFTVTGAGLAQTVDVNPAAGIMTALSSITSVVELQGATTQSGQQVLVGSLAQANAETFVSGLTQTIAIANTLPPDGSPSGAQLHTAAATVRGPGAAIANAIQGSALPSGFAFGVEMGAGGQALFHDAASVRNNLLPRVQAVSAASGSPISDAIGDVLSFLRSAWHTVENVVVQTEQNVVHLIVTLADQVFDAVMDALEHVFGVIDWLFNLIAVDLQKLLDWLGFIFGWGDIKATHAVLVNLAVQTIDYMQYAISGAETAVNTFFDSVESRFKSITTLPASVSSTGVAAQSSQATSSDSGPLGLFKHGPSANFSQFQVAHGGVLNTNPAPPSVGADVAQLLSDFVTKIVEPTVSDVSDTMKNLFDDLRDAFEGGTLTPAQVLAKMGADAVVGILEVGRTLATGALTILQDLTELVLDALTAILHIPLLSALYEDVVGEQMTVLNGLALLTAIPVTVIYKIATGQAPFAGDTIGLASADFQTVATALGFPISAPTNIANSGANAGTQQGSEAVAKATASGDPSPSELAYSHIGGYIYSAAWALSVTTQFYSVVSETEATWPNQVGLVFSLIAAAASFPVGDDTDKDGLAWERVEWVNVVLAVFRDGLGLYLGEASQPGIGALQLVQAVLGLVIFIVVMVEELVGDYPATTSVIKFIQNLINSVSDGLAGASKTIPKEDPDPDSKALKQALEAVSAVLAYIACAINLARTASTDSGDISYVF